MYHLDLVSDLYKPRLLRTSYIFLVDVTIPQMSNEWANNKRVTVMMTTFMYQMNFTTDTLQKK